MRMSHLVFVILFICAIYSVTAEKVIMCYYGTWATYRPELGQFSIEHINVDLCTHLIYSFTGIEDDGTMVSLDPFLDLDYGHGNFRKFTALKNIKPDLVTMIAVGGWNEGSAKYSIMAANPTYRQNFIRSALNMIQEYNFDGLDLDWEYPNDRDTVNGEADVDNFSLLIREAKEEFQMYGLLLTAAVASGPTSAARSYDIPAISEYLDFINLMTYDMYGSWNNVTGHNAPLHKGEGDDENEEVYAVDMAVDYWLSEGCPPEKLVLGLPMYGRTFLLTDPEVNGVRAPASGPGIAGPYSLLEGFLGYNEICELSQEEKWDIKYDNLAKVPYAIRADDWISYDDPESTTKKVQFAKSRNLAGGMVWSMETDDFHGLCEVGDFPLMRAIKETLEAEDEVTTEGTEEPNTDSTTTEAVTQTSDFTTGTTGGSTTTEATTTPDTTTTEVPTTDYTTTEITTTTEGNKSAKLLNLGILNLIMICLCQMY